MCQAQSPRSLGLSSLGLRCRVSYYAPQEKTLLPQEDRKKSPGQNYKMLQPQAKAEQLTPCPCPMPQLPPARLRHRGCYAQAWHQGKGMQSAETEGHPRTKRGQESCQRTHKLHLPTHGHASSVYPACSETRAAGRACYRKRCSLGRKHVTGSSDGPCHAFLQLRRSRGLPSLRPRPRGRHRRKAPPPRLSVSPFSFFPPLKRLCLGPGASLELLRPSRPALDPHLGRLETSSPLKQKFALKWWLLLGSSRMLCDLAFAEAKRCARPGIALRILAAGILSDPNQGSALNLGDHRSCDEPIL